MSTIYITTQGACLRKRAGALVVMQKDSEIQSIPEAMVECVVLLGAVQVSTQAMMELLDHGIPLLYLSRGGHFRGILQPGLPKNVERRLVQYERSVDPVYAPAVARAFVDAKIASSIEALRQWGKNGWGDTSESVAGLRICRTRLGEVAGVASLRAVEGQAAKYHFSGLGACLPPGFAWNGRNRQPPRDPVNALLSLSYMLVVGFAVAAAYAGGLDPFVGFLHQLEYGRPGFALDLLEPLRAGWCDHAVLKTLQAEALGSDDFETTRDDGCRLTSDGLARFLRIFQNQLNPESPLGVTRPLQNLVHDLQDSMRERKPPAWSEPLGKAA